MRGLWDARFQHTAWAAKQKARRKQLFHARQANALPQRVSAESDAFLDSPAWKRLRYDALQTYGRKCMCCGATPESGAILNVDHIKPRKRYPELAFSLSNLQILCEDCNEGKGNRDETDFRPNQRHDEQPNDCPSTSRNRLIKKAK